MRRLCTLLLALVWTLCGERGWGAEPPQCACCQGVKTTRSGAWIVRETACFRIYTLPDTHGVTHLPGTCESLRKHLQTTWLGDEQTGWTPKCDIVLHPSLESYSRHLGRGSEQSSGCSTLQVDTERIVQRRIDLRADAADWLSAALPHELTHVVVADRFTRRQIPRWADEGMAILAEPRSKQLVRQREMEASLAHGLGFTPAELATTQDYPEARRRNAFYGQSAALVARLAKQDSPAKFLENLVAAVESGRTAQTARLPAPADDAQHSWRFVDSGSAPRAPNLAEAVSTIVAATK